MKELVLQIADFRLQIEASIDSKLQYSNNRIKITEIAKPNQLSAPSKQRRLQHHKLQISKRR